MEKKKNKTELDYLQAHSLRALLTQVNTHNIENQETPILREDIVDIIKEDDTFILLYYK